MSSSSIISGTSSADGMLIEACGSKSFRRKDGGDDDRQVLGRNAERNFHQKNRSSETRQSMGAPEARLYKKGDGQPAKLCYMGHALMENRHGAAVGGGVSQASGTAEPDNALQLIDGRSGRGRRITLGADKAYDVTPFVHELRDRSVTPRIAIDGRIPRHAGYEIRQSARKRIDRVCPLQQPDSERKTSSFRMRCRR